jgi:murein L,D-transpeptidase YcbB/YkuD
VRVQDPMAFADALMANEPNISRASLEAMFGSSERWVNPETQIPVHLAYFTLRVDADGTIRSFGDVYGHHEKLIAAMGLDTTTEPAIVAEAETGPRELSP